VLWNFDTTLRLLIDSGSYVGSDVIVAFCSLIAQTAAIRDHAMKALAEALNGSADNQPLLQVAGWALGEFLDDPGAIVDTLARITTLPQTTVETKLVMLTALSKLSVRFGVSEKVIAHLKLFVNNNNLEVQQRAGELIRVLARPDVAEQLLTAIEVDETQGMTSERSQSAELIDFNEPAEAKAEPEVNQKEEKVINGPPGSVEALRTPDYVIYFELQRNPNNPRQLGIRSTVYGLGQLPLTNFTVQYGVPQGWVITAQPQSATVLEPEGGKPIQQVLFLQNNGVVGLRMATQISYMYHSQPIKEQNEINHIFG
jgi:hypothetical protein